MKKILFSMAIATMAFTQINAQDNAPANRPEPLTPEQRTEKHVQMLTDKLSLTDAQKSQLTTLFTDFDKTREAQAKADKEAKDKLDADILALLTSDQQATYKQMQAQHQKGAHHRHQKDARSDARPDFSKGEAPTPQQMADFRIARLDEKLTLTADQKTKIKALYTDLDSQLAAQKGANQKPDPQAFQKTMDQLDSNICALLTSDQQTAFVRFLKDEASFRHNDRPNRPRDCHRG